VAKTPSAPGKKALATKRKAKFPTRGGSAEEPAYDPEANIIPARPTPGIKPSELFGFWRKTRPELFR